MGYSEEEVPQYKVSQLNKTFYELGELDASQELSVIRWMNECEDEFGMKLSTVAYWETEGDEALSEHLNFLEYLTTK